MDFVAALASKVTALPFVTMTETLRENQHREVGRHSLGVGQIELDGHVAAIRIAGILKPTPQRREHMRLIFVRGGVAEHRNHRCRLLRPRHYRPRRGRAAEKLDEVAPSHCRLSLPQTQYG
jgi:hypothetical protein